MQMRQVKLTADRLTVSACTARWDAGTLRRLTPEMPREAAKLGDGFLACTGHVCHTCHFRRLGKSCRNYTEHECSTSRALQNDLQLRLSLMSSCKPVQPIHRLPSVHPRGRIAVELPTRHISGVWGTAESDLSANQAAEKKKAARVDEAVPRAGNEGVGEWRERKR